MSSRQRLQGKVALITGGASGIGAAHARIFAQEGAKVLICDVQAGLGAEVAAAVDRLGGEGAFCFLDVTDEHNWRSAVAEAVARFGGLSTLVSNAGIYQAAGLDTESMEGWNRIVSVNQTGTWLAMKASMPELLKTGNAAIVVIGSIYGIVGSPGSIAYHASNQDGHRRWPPRRGIAVIG